MAKPKAESYVVTISTNDGRVLIGRIVGYFNMIVDSIISSHNAAFIELMALDDDKYHSYIKKEAIGHITNKIKDIERRML